MKLRPRDELLVRGRTGLRPDHLAMKAAALELKARPRCVAPAMELATAGQAGRGAPQQSRATPPVAGRELDTADVIASKAHIDAIALRLPLAGIDCHLGRLRALPSPTSPSANPLDRINPRPATHPHPSRKALPAGRRTDRARPTRLPTHRPAGHALAFPDHLLVRP